MATGARFAGRVAVVTGAASGIGRATAIRLAEEGAAVALVDRDAAGAEETAATLRRAGARAGVHACDVASSAQVASTATRIAEELGPVDVLANVAGIGDTAGLEGIEEIDDARWSLVLAVNLSGAFYWCRALLPGMAARGRGAVVNVSSVASFIYSPGNVNYCASKAYLTTFSEGLALELEGTGVAVQALCPSFTHTEFHQRMGPDAKRRPRFMWMTAEAVVAASLSQLERHGQVICVPGVRNRMLVAAIRLLPRRLVGRLSRRTAYAPVTDAIAGGRGQP